MRNFSNRSAAASLNISGFQNKDLRRRLRDRTSGQTSQTMKRLRVQGLIKKVGRTYKHYLTALGKQVVAPGLKLKERLHHPSATQPAPRSDRRSQKRTLPITLSI